MRVERADGDTLGVGVSCLCNGRRVTGNCSGLMYGVMVRWFDGCYKSCQQDE